MGKESNDLDDNRITGVVDGSYIESNNINAYILKLLSTKPKDAQKMGVSKRQYYRVIKKYRDNEL
jgi:hypothetical protein